VPLVAGMALLSKIQNDVKNAEADVVSYLMKAIDANDFKFDKLSAVVVAPTSYVLAGQPYEAQVFLTASDSKKEPDVFVNGSKLETEEGKGIYKAPTGKPGFYKWKGVIKVKKPDGSVEEYETEEVEYQVAEPSVNVSPDKMNVLYIGVENPITVSGAGIPAEKIIATISDGSLSKSSGAGSYIARVDKQGKANVTVYYEPKPGERKNLGTKEFRVKRIPDPVCKFGGRATGKLARAVMAASSGLIAELENFDFDARFTVKSFTFTITLKSGDAIPYKSSSAYLTQEMKDAIGRIRPGEKIYFDEIVLNEPGGGTRNLQTGVVLEAL
jgi:gliding motility-associated protein GldM